MRITRKEQVALLGGTVVCLVAAAVGISNAAPAAKPRAVAAPTTWYQCVNTAGASESTKGGTAVPTCAHSVDRIISWPVNVYTPPAPTTTTKPPGTTTTAHVTTSIFNPTTTAAPATTLPAPTTTMAPSGGLTNAPVGNLPGWTQVMVENFTKNAATGSWGTTDANKVVYTGDDGAKWLEYPDGWASTNSNGNPGYNPSTVLSVHDGVLDFSLKPINGHAEGANPSPLLGASDYQTFGQYCVRMKTDKVAGYHDAWLLWPSDDNAWQSAESDFPEMDLTDSTVSGYAHYGGSGSQDAFEGTKVDLTQWHVYCQTWQPGQRQYLVDGTVIGTSTHSVYAGPERWQLQTEPSSTAAGGTGHQLVDWAVAYSRA